MAYDVRLGNYVKFLRGTPTAWESITEKNSDTLYFIAEEGAATGKLYLGSKLIADGSNSNITTLRELTDVVLNAGVPNQSVLAYDAVSETWKDTPLESLLSGIVGLMHGASETENGASGLVPRPMAGDHILYLRGDGTWADPTEALSAVVSGLAQTVADNKEAHDNDINTLLGGYPKGTTIEGIVNEHVSKIVGSAPETFDTLEEISDWIKKHDGAINIADTLARLSAVENTLNTPDTGLVDRVEIMEVELHGDGASKVGLIDKHEALSETVTVLVNTVGDVKDGLDAAQKDILKIYDALKWQDLYEVGE